MYTVCMNKFHDGYLLYRGKSLAQAIRVARRYDCDDCLCGGPSIVRDTDGAMLNNWQAAKPFHPANVAYWQGKVDYWQGGVEYWQDEKV
jgi:hypothetical protein